MGTVASEQVGQAAPAKARKTLLSIVTPAFNEAENLPVLYERLCRGDGVARRGLGVGGCR